MCRYIEEAGSMFGATIVQAMWGDALDRHQEALTTRMVTASSGDDRPVAMPNFMVPMVFSAKEAGVYNVVLWSGGIDLGSLPFEVRLTSEP